MVVATNLEKTDLEAIVLGSPEVQATIARLAVQGSRDEQKLRAVAKKYLSNMRAEISPKALGLGLYLANGVIEYSFTDVQVSGLEKTTLDLLRRGGVALFSTHFSYLGDVITLPHVLADKGINGAYYIAGDNVPRIPPIGPFVKKFFNGCGAVIVKRDFSGEGKESLLFRAVLQAYVSFLITRNKNVVNFAGRGRHKTGEVKPVDFSGTPAIIEEEAQTLPVAITYDIVPDDRTLVFSQRRGLLARPLGRFRKPRSFFEPLTFVRWDRGYGTIYVNFGEPFSTEAYAAQCEPGKPVPKHVVNSFHSEVTQRLIKLVTLTPVNALAVLVSDRGYADFGIGDIMDSARNVVGKATDVGVNVSDKLLLPGKSLQDALLFGAEKLVERGGLTYANGAFGVREQRMITYYSNTVRPTLQAYGVIPQTSR